tara:strand:+ start:1946 stop:2515 length:570 start_codon:yes stop_codon:yes gene_type:complete
MTAIKKKSFTDKLSAIQQGLKAPKNQFNGFGKYKYRSTEDILEAVKPLLGGLVLTLNDELIEVGGVLVIQTTAEISDSEGNFKEVTANAGIDLNRKGMDVAQSFGSSGSYAHKYALGNLFLIDDTKDVDATNTHNTNAKKVLSDAGFKKVLEKFGAEYEGEIIDGGWIDKRYSLSPVQVEKIKEVQNGK